MTRVPFAIWTPATFDPAYPNGKHYAPRSLDGVLYVVNHDARGYRAYLRQGHRPGEEASWTFTNQTDGVLLQHFELEQPTWTSGGPVQNKAGIATEHENLAGAWGFPTFEVLTPAQIRTDRHLFTFLKALCPNLRAPLLGAGFREHEELTNGATSCPSGRIQPLYDSYLQAPPPKEDDMPIGDAVDDWLVPGEPRNLLRSTQHLNRRVEQVNDRLSAVVAQFDERIKALDKDLADHDHAGTGTDGAHTH